jgi:hypothetical protein
MASTWSTNLKIELLGVGDTNWGTLTNNNFQYAFEDSITGYATVTFPSDANYDWAALYTNSNSSQEQRNLVLNVVGTLSTTRELIVPTIEKQYIVQNNTTGGQAITVKTSAGTGVTVPNGRKMHVYADGTNVIQMSDYDVSRTIGTLSLTTALSVASGGTGITSFGTGVATALGQNVTGSGGIVLATSPVLITPNLGTPSALTLTNATGLPIVNGTTGTLSISRGGTGITSFGMGVSTALGQNVTGSGGIVLDTSPTLVTPALGVATATSITLTTLNATSVEATNLRAKDGTAAATIANSTGKITISTELAVDNLNLSGNTLSTTNTNGNLTLAPNGSGSVFTDTANGVSLFVRNTTASSSGSSIISFQNLDGASNYRTVARASGVTDGNGGNGGFLVETAFSTALYKGLFVDKDSNVFFYDTSNNASLKWSAVDKYLGINQTSPTANLDVNGTAKISTDSSSAALSISQLGAGNALLIEDSANPDATPLVIDQFGNLIIGATARSTSVASKIEINSTGTETSGLTPSLNLTNWSSSSTLGGSNLSFFHYPSGSIGTVIDNTSGDLLGRISFFTRQSTTLYGGSISGSTASTLTGVNLSYSAASHRFTGSIKVGGTADRATTEGTNQLVLFNGTAPVGTLANGISFYSASGEANVMDAAGNATLLSPHDAETNEWIFRSKHTPSGKVLKINVERLLRFVNDHFGLEEIQEFVEK